MSNRLSKEKAEAIAAEYCTNGFKKVMALLNLGYKPSYAKSKTGLRIYDNVLVREAIEKIQAKTRLKTSYTVDDCLREYEEARLLAMAEKQPAAAATAITGKARLYGYDKDTVMTEKTTIVISPRKVIESKALCDNNR